MRFRLGLNAFAVLFGTASIVAIGFGPAVSQECQFQVCVDLHRANELGMELALIEGLRSLGVKVGENIYQLPQANANDLQLGLNIRELIESTHQSGATLAAEDQVMARLGADEGAAFALGVEMARVLLTAVLLTNNQGKKLGLESGEQFLLSRWPEAVERLNDWIGQIGFISPIEEEFDSIEAIQEAVCQRKLELNRAFNQLPFRCDLFLDRVQRVIQKDARAETKRLDSGDEITVRGTATDLEYRVDGKTVARLDISDYQDGNAIGEEDITYGDSAVAVRLGRKNDMLVISGVRRAGDQICVRHLFLQLRDGDNIQISYRGTVREAEVFGYRYGRERDLFNLAGVRESDFSFVWDPSAPRTGERRDPVTPVETSNGVFVSEIQCK